MITTITQSGSVYTCVISCNSYQFTAHHHDYRQVQIMAIGAMLDAMWYVLRDEGNGVYERF